jgi:AcrR family transcriptional regulator
MLCAVEGAPGREQERGSRARTRQAIIAAAIDVLGTNPAASLGEVAAAADVGRTTLHRYFPDRADLIRAVSEEAVAGLDRATEQARLDDGPAADALARLCREYFDLGGLLSLLCVDPGLLDTSTWEQQCGDVAFAAMVTRGHADGTIDRELPAPWVHYLMWSQLYAAWSYINETGTSRHEAARLLIRSLLGSVRPPR